MKTWLLLFALVAVSLSAAPPPLNLGPESVVTHRLKTNATAQGWRRGLGTPGYEEFRPSTHSTNGGIGLANPITAPVRIVAGTGTNEASDLYIGSGGFSIQSAFIDIRNTGARSTDLDHTVAIQKAIDSANGVPIRIPDGTWNVTTLNVTRDTQIEGSEKAKLFHMATAVNAMVVVTGAKLKVRGLTMDGNWQNRHDRREDVVNLTSIISSRDQNSTVHCVGTVFTNSQRAAVSIAGPGWFSECLFMNIKTNSTDGNGTSGNTFGIFAQPAGYHPQLHLQVEGCTFQGCTGLDEDLVYLSARGIWVSEQANQVNTLLNTNRYTITIVNNCLYGLGGWFHSTVGSAIEIYNGAQRPIIMGNRIECYGHGGISVQRTPNAQIIGNSIINGKNAYDGLGGIYLGNSHAIIYEPQAREGFSPFTGDRAGEHHYNGVIGWNVITNGEQNAFYVVGDDVLVKNNIVDTMKLGHTPAVTHLLGSRIDVVGNIFKNCAKYVISSTAVNRGIRVYDNAVYADQSTSTDAMFLFQNTTDLKLSRNYFLLSEGNDCTVHYLDSVTNVVVETTDIHNSGVGIRVLGASRNVKLEGNYSTGATSGDWAIDTLTTTDVWQWNNSWQPYRIRNDKPALTYFEVGNFMNTNLASAAIHLATMDTGGGIYQYPLGYIGTRDAGRMVITPDTTAVGVNLVLPEAADDYRWYFVNTLRMRATDAFTYFRGSSTIPLLVDSDSATVTGIGLTANGVTQSRLLWQNGVGFVVVDSTGSNNNLTVSDAGDGSFRGNLAAVNLNLSGNVVANNRITVDDNATAGNTRLMIWDVDNGTLERVRVGAPDSGGVGFKVLIINN